MAKTPLFAFRIAPEAREHLRAVAAERDTTTAALIIDALRKAGYLPPVEDDASAAA